MTTALRTGAVLVFDGDCGFCTTSVTWLAEQFPEAFATVPYQRTGKLEQSWTWKVTATGSGLRGEVGTNMSYAHWVQRQGSQARIHKGNWLTDYGAVQQKRDEIGRRFRSAIKAALASGPSGG